MRLELSAFVEGDLDRIAATIAKDNPRRAVTFIQDIRARLATVGRDPLIYQLRPDIGEAARMASVGRYAILFRLPATWCGSSAWFGVGVTCPTR